MNKYKPGTSVRISLTSLLKQNPADPGVLTDPVGSVVTVCFPGPSGTTKDGSQQALTGLKDSNGQWHADFLVPITTPPGVGAHRWQSSGTATAQAALAELRFQVLSLDF